MLNTDWVAGFGQGVRVGEPDLALAADDAAEGRVDRLEKARRAGFADQKAMSYNVTRKCPK